MAYASAFFKGETMFKREDKFKLDEHLDRKYQFLAHIKDGGKEDLKDHLELALDYFFELDKKKCITEKFKKICKRLRMEDFEKLYGKIILNTIYMHDMGKINPAFQKLVLENSLNIKITHSDSNHSMLSAYIYINFSLRLVPKEVQNTEKEKLFLYLIFLNGYIISKHHGSLDSIDGFVQKLCEQDGKNFYASRDEWLSGLENFNVFSPEKLKNFWKMASVIKSINNEENMGLYIYSRLLSSILLACDYYSTTEYMSGNAVDFGDGRILKEFATVYDESDLVKGIRNAIAPKNSINELRNNLFLEAEKNYVENKLKNIFYLEAPTGSGKSNVALNVSLKMVEDFNMDKVIYVYPFNTLVEQNMEILKNSFSSNQDVVDEIAVINSVTPIKIQTVKTEEDETTNYEKSLLDKQFLHYSFILTSHVNLFRGLFGTSKENLFPLIHLANSVIVLDEIQSYKNKIWNEIILFLEAYSDLLNIKILIMSATLPNLSILTGNKNKSQQLINDRAKYFENPVFKDRVKLDYGLLEDDYSEEKLINHIENNSVRGSILIEFISKKSAQEFYKKLKEKDLKSEILLLTGDDNIIERKQIINKIKNLKKEEKVILVATQVIEAGIDIDMDLGYKDISLLDNEEQFLGRINRSNKKVGSVVYFFDKDKAANIYKYDIRKENNYTLKRKDIRVILNNKSFDEYYHTILKAIQKQNEAENYAEANLYEELKQMNHKKVEKRMELIEDNNDILIFLNRKIEVEGEIIDGSEVWEEYEKILKDNTMNFPEKKIKLSLIMAKVNNFVYQCKYTGFSDNGKIGNIYYIDNGEEYFEDGKFDRSKLSKGFEIL